MYTYLEQIKTIYPHDIKEENSIHNKIENQNKELVTIYKKYAQIKILYNIMDSQETLEQYQLDLEKYDLKQYRDKIMEIWITELEQTQPINVSFFKKARQEFNIKN